MSETRTVFFFDVDNTLYSRNKNIQYMMSDLIDEYFMTHLSLSQEDANQLHLRYFKDYGLAIEGLIRHHKVDALEYNSKVDDALPLDGVITPDAQLRDLLESFDTSKVKLWLFTNAYITHGKRVAKLLEVEELFEGITYCDYGAKEFICKPSDAMFEKAKNDAGVSSTDQCYFVDDSALNCTAAERLGWNSIYYLEPFLDVPEKTPSKYLVRSLYELRSIFPQFFKDRSAINGGSSASATPS